MNDNKKAKEKGRVRQLSQKFESSQITTVEEPTYDNQDGDLESSGETLLKTTKTKKTPESGNSEDSAASGETWVCAECNFHSSNDDTMMIECDRCCKHFCLLCLDMEESVYNYMSREDVLWCCVACCSIVKEQILAKSKIVSQIEEETTEIVSRAGEMLNLKMKDALKDFGEAIDSLKSSLEIAPFQCFSGESSDTGNGSNGEAGGQTPDDPDVQAKNPWKIQTRPVRDFKMVLKEAMSEQKKEDEEKSKRESNIIIYRAPESKHVDTKMRIDHDRQFFNQLCNSVLEIGELETVEVTRLGKKTNPDDARPLRIKLNNKLDKLKLFDSLGKLRVADTPFKSLSIADDMTQREREEVKKLVTEAKNQKIMNERYRNMRYRIKRTDGQFQIRWLQTSN